MASSIRKAFLAAFLCCVPLFAQAEEYITAIVSDDVTALTQGSGLFVYRMKGDFILDEVRAELTTPQATGAPVAIDLQTAGVSYFSSLPAIPNTKNSSYGSTTAGVIANNKIADETPLSINVSIGDGTAKGLKVTLIGHRPPNSTYVGSSAPPPPPPPPPPGMTIVALGTGHSSGSSGNATITGVTVPAGAFIGVFTNENCVATSGMTVGDGTNTYVPTTLPAPSGNLCPGFFTVTNAAALTNATITFNQHSASDGASLAAFYITGAATASAIDAAVTATSSGSSSSPSVASGVPSQSGEMFVGVTWGVSCGTFTQAGSWSTVDSAVCNSQATATLIGEGSQLNTGTGTLVYNPSLGSSQAWLAGVYGIKHP